MKKKTIIQDNHQPVGKGAIRRIKDLLYDYPEIQQRWYEYKDNNE
ncbi:MAG: hypothetical protein ACLKAK_01505 [Alkaliphilus sp.]